MMNALRYSRAGRFAAPGVPLPDDGVRAIVGARQPDSPNVRGPTPPPSRASSRSSLRTFAAASLIACSLILYGCGGDDRAPVATPGGGGPAPTLPPATTPQPSQPTIPTQPQTPQPPPSTPPLISTPSPLPPQPEPPPLHPQPLPPTSQPVSTPPPAQPTQPSAPSTQLPTPPPQTDKFGIESGDDADAVEKVLESIDANALLKPLLEGHVLSYDGSSDGVAGIRNKLGLPASGTDFSNATGLAAVWGKGIEILFGKNSGRGDGAGLQSASSVRTFSNWVDGVFFGTANVGGTEGEIASFVIGVPSGVNPDPVGAQSTAVWKGPVIGRKLAPIGHLEGNATLTYDFGAANLDVVFSSLLYYPYGLPPTQGVGDMSWDDLSVSNGKFGDCSGTGDCIRGRFFDDNEGNAAESVGGVFRRGTLRGAFGARRR